MSFVHLAGFQCVPSRAPSCSTLSLYPGRCPDLVSPVVSPLSCPVLSQSALTKGKESELKASLLALVSLRRAFVGCGVCMSRKPAPFPFHSDWIRSVQSVQVICLCFAEVSFPPLGPFMHPPSPGPHLDSTRAKH